MGGKTPMACEMQFTLYLGQYLTQKKSEELGRHVFTVATRGMSWDYYSYWVNLIAMLPHNPQSVHPHQT